MEKSWSREIRSIPKRKKFGHKVYMANKLKEKIMSIPSGKNFSEKCCLLMERQLSFENISGSVVDSLDCKSNSNIKKNKQSKKTGTSLDSIHSPFRYAGGKYYARKLIVEHIPEHTVYCEPFAGGGSIFFAKKKVMNNILNDKDELLMLVYRIIRDNPDDLIEFLKPHGANKETHTFFKNEFIPTNDIEKAGRWYYLNRTSYSGIMNMPNCYWGYGDKFSMQPHNWPKAIKEASEKLQNVELTHGDFEATVNTLPSGSFLFIDPPYYNADQDKFYTESFEKADHERLSNVLQRHSHRMKMFITYDNCEEVRNLYSWAENFYDKEWNYCIARTDDQKNGTDIKGKRKKGKELFILNY